MVFSRQTQQSFLEGHIKNKTPGLIYKLKDSSEEEIIKSFAGGLDKLKRLDGYNEKEIKFIVNFVIWENKIDKPSQKFYRLEQIQTIDKLRTKNKEKVPYFVTLIEPAKKAYITNKSHDIWTIEV